MSDPSSAPGPWKIGHTFAFQLVEHNPEPFDAIEINAGKKNVLLVPLDDKEEGLAVARLVVLAPRMLAALESALPHIECSNNKHSILTECFQLIAEAKETA